MHIRPNPNPVPTASQLTRGIHGRNLEQVSEHLAAESSDTVSVLGQGLKSQMTQDLKALQRAVEAQEAASGKNALQSTSFHAAAMVAGSLLGVSGMVMHDLAGKLHQVAQNPEALQQLAEDVRDRTQGEGTSSHVLNGLAHRVLQANVEQGSTGANAPVAMFLSGGFLQAEQRQDSLLSSVAARQPEVVLDFEFSDARLRSS